MLCAKSQTEQLQQEILDAQCSDDLLCAANELSVLEEFKNVLLRKLNRYNRNDGALNQIYFRVMPLDKILNDDILCSIFRFLPFGAMYGTLSVINRHFRHILTHYASLYCAYRIRLNYCGGRDAMYLKVCHRTKTIHLSHIRETEKWIEIRSAADIESKCPFFWFCAKKLVIVPTTIFSRRLMRYSTLKRHQNDKMHGINKMDGVLQRNRNLSGIPKNTLN